MELVDGIPITRYCDDKRMTVEERIALFIPVCQAIQHAHQKGIIHRTSSLRTCWWRTVRESRSPR